MKLNCLLVALSLLGATESAYSDESRYSHSNVSAYDIEMPAGLAHALEDAEQRGIDVEKPNCLEHGTEKRCVLARYKGLSASLKDKDMHRFQILPNRKMDVVGVLAGNVFFKANSSDQIDFEVFENADDAVFVFEQGSENEYYDWISGLGPSHRRKN